jgi:hypothetical protein
MNHLMNGRKAGLGACLKTFTLSELCKSCPDGSECLMLERVASTRTKLRQHGQIVKSIALRKNPKVFSRVGNDGHRLMSKERDIERRMPNLRLR